MNGSEICKMLPAGAVRVLGADAAPGRARESCEGWDRMRERILALVQEAEDSDPGEASSIPAGAVLQLLGLTDAAEDLSVVEGEAPGAAGVAVPGLPGSVIADADGLAALPNVIRREASFPAAAGGEGVAGADGPVPFLMEEATASREVLIPDLDSAAGEADPSGDADVQGRGLQAAERPTRFPGPAGQAAPRARDGQAGEHPQDALRTGPERSEQLSPGRSRKGEGPADAGGPERARAVLETVRGPGEGLETAREALQRAIQRDVAPAGGNGGEVMSVDPVAAGATAPDQDPGEVETGAAVRLVRDVPREILERPGSFQLRRGEDTFLRLRVRDHESRPLTIRLRAGGGELVGRMQSGDGSLLRDLSESIGALRRNLEGLGYARVDVQVGSGGRDSGGRPHDRYPWRTPPGHAAPGGTIDAGEIPSPVGTVNLLA